MKKIIILFCAFFLVISCSVPNYMFENKAQTIGVDFTKGKWLINDIDSPGIVYKQLTDESLKTFGLYLNDRLYTVYSVKGIILPKKINFNPSKNEIHEMKKGCVDFDYFINIRAGKLKEEIGFLYLNSRNSNKTKSNQSEVEIEIYDLNHSETIYSQKIIGTINTIKDNQDIHFSKATYGLIMGCYKRLINDIVLKSIK